MHPTTRDATLRAALIVAAVALGACGSSAPSALPAVSGSPTAAAGTLSPTATATASAIPSTGASASAGAGFGGRTGRIDVPAAGLALTLPEGWVEIPFDEAALDAMIGSLPTDSPYREMLEAQGPALAGGAISLLAFDLAGDPGIAAGSNLSVISQPTEIPPSLLASIVRTSLSQLPNVQGEPTLVDVTIDGVDAVRADFSLEQEAEAQGEPMVLDATQLYVSANGRFTILTLGIRRGAEDVRDEVVDSIDLLD